MERRRQGLISKIVASLRRRGLDPLQEWDFGGVRVDVLVQSLGWTLVVEAKAVRPTGVQVDSAMNQIRLYEQELGADRAIAVFDRLDYSIPEKGIVAWRDFNKFLPSFLEGPGLSRVPASRGRPTARARPVSRTVFAAMPFAPEYTDTYLVAMSHAAEANGATCVRVDHEDFVGDVVYEIRRLIEASVAVIGDVSESRPNVLYEVGFARALGKPTVLICSTPLREMPFDVRNENTIHYRRGQTVALREQLESRLRGVLSAQGNGS